MLPGHPNNYIAAMAAHAHQQAYAAVHAVIHATTHHRNAAVLDLADRLVGHMSAKLLNSLRIQTTTTQVQISAASQKHAIQQRQIAGTVDVELVASRIVEAFQDVRYELLPRRQSHVPRLVGYVQSADRWLVLPIKFVQANRSASGIDEFWVSTAHPLGSTNFDEAKRKGRLISL